MKLKAPKQITFWIAVIVAAIGVIIKLLGIPPFSGLVDAAGLAAYPGWLLLIGFVILALGNLVKGL